MTKTIKLLLIVAGLLLATSVGFGQTILVNTTLSTAAQAQGSVFGATPSGNQSVISVASATGISAPVPNTSLTSGIAATSDAQTYLYVDRELMQVKAVSGLNITVIRGIASTSAASHLSGAVVFVIPSNLMQWMSAQGLGQSQGMPSGSCTRTNELVLPRIDLVTGRISDCLGGQWINGDATQTTRTVASSIFQPQPGGTAYTSLNTNGTTLVAGTLFCNEIQMPYSRLVSGLGVLNGTTVGTDNHLVALYDSTGNLIANSATAGVLAANASTYQQISFTAKYWLAGPAQYFGCVQSNGTTATVRMLVTGTQDQYITTSKTGSFGTIPATITIPTTFTTAVGPYLTLF